MNRSIQVLLAGAGTVCIAYGLKRVFARKRINTLPYGIKLKQAVTVAHSKEEVQLASEDSFPASDAPAWTGTTGPSAPRH